MNVKEKTLKSFIGKNGWDYKITQNYRPTRRNLELKKGEQNLALRYDGEDYGVCLPIREKVYYNDGSIRRSGGVYSITTPKSATGEFSVSDREISLVGELNKGKVVELDTFQTQVGKYNAGSVSPNIIRGKLKQLLFQSEHGKIELQNITKVLIGKVLEYLPRK